MHLWLWIVILFTFGFRKTHNVMLAMYPSHHVHVDVESLLTWYLLWYKFRLLPSEVIGTSSVKTHFMKNRLKSLEGFPQLLIQSLLKISK